MKLCNLDGSTLMEVNALDIDEGSLIIRGTIMGTMPVTSMLTPSEVRNLLKLLSPRLFLFLLTLPFRRDRAAT